MIAEGTVLCESTQRNGRHWNSLVAIIPILYGYTPFLASTSCRLSLR